MAGQQLLNISKMARQFNIIIFEAKVKYERQCVRYIIGNYNLKQK